MLANAAFVQSLPDSLLRCDVRVCVCEKESVESFELIGKYVWQLPIAHRL